MNSINVILIFLVIIILNVFFLLKKSSGNYLKAPIIFWAIIFLIFSIVILVQKIHLNNLDNQYQKETHNENYCSLEKWGEIKKYRHESLKTNLVFFHFLGLQTLFTFIWQIRGYRNTEKKIYNWSTGIFALLFSLYLILALMIELIPKGRIF